jgi:hypothetical protein
LACLAECDCTLKGIDLMTYQVTQDFIRYGGNYEDGGASSEMM